MRTLRLSVMLGLLLALPTAVPAQAQDVVFLIRHAERDFTQSDGGLLEEGKERAEAWGEVFHDAGLDLIITSEMNRTRETGQPIDKIEADMHRDFWLSAQEAVDYGLLNKVVTSETELG